MTVLADIEADVPAPRRAARKASIENRIVMAALEAIMRVGADRFALADTAKLADVSRTTLYKYYPERDDLLSAVSDRLRAIYAAELAEAITGHDTPEDRLRTVIAFMRTFHDRWRAHQMVQVQIRTVLHDINRNFDFYCSVVEEALAPAIVALDVAPAAGRLFVEMLIRMQLSAALVPMSEDWKRLPDLAVDLWRRLIR